MERRAVPPDATDDGLDELIYGSNVSRLRPVAAPDQPPLILSAARLPDPTTIPPRRWLLGTQLLRGFVSVLVAPGGTGKTVLAMTAGVSLATGTKLLDLHVWERVNVAIFNEDPLDEMERRLAAIMIRHKIDPTEVAGRYFMNSMDERRLLMATNGPDGFSVIHPDEDALCQQIKANEIGLLIVDPFAESHTLEENSNPAMIAAAAAWRRVARLTSCAILLVHHVRKGAQDAGIDAARGAKGLTDSARVGLVLTGMSEQEAKAAGVPEAERHGYVRLDDAKVNLSPRIDKARWFRLEQVALHNKSQDYPSGDKVAAIVPWTPPSVWAAVTTAQINLALDRIAAGLNPETPYTDAITSKDKRRWCGHVLVEELDVSEEQAKIMIRQWLESGLLYTAEYVDPAQRKARKCVRVDTSKRPT